MTGSKILAAAAERITPTMMELGGKNASLGEMYQQLTDQGRVVRLLAVDAETFGPALQVGRRERADPLPRRPLPHRRHSAGPLPSPLPRRAASAC